MKSISLSLGYFKVVALGISLSLVLSSFAFLAFTHNSEAASFTFVSDTISDSDLGVNADHLIVLTSPTGIAADDSTLTITFPGEFNVSTTSLAITDVDVDHGAGDLSIAADCTGAEDLGLVIAGQTLTFTFCNLDGGALAAGGTTTIEIGTNAGGVNQIDNAAEAGSYVINIQSRDSGSTLIDDADTRIVVIDDVVVTAEVETIFTFVINGMATGTSVNGSPTTTVDSTTSTTLPFGILAPGISHTLAQNLQVTTNARNGFTVTINQDQNLLSSTGADIDRFFNDSGTASTVPWAGPAGTIGVETTYGHMGVTSDDETLGDTDLTTHFYTDYWAGNFVNNPREVMYHDGPADGIVDGQGSTTVGYQAEIMAFQEAGSDYTANLTYVATPTF